MAISDGRDEMKKIFKNRKERENNGKEWKGKKKGLKRVKTKASTSGRWEKDKTKNYKE